MRKKIFLSAAILAAALSAYAQGNGQDVYNRQPLQLFNCRTFPCVHERRKIIFQFGVAAQNGEYSGVFFVQQFNGMGECAILTVLIDKMCIRDRVSITPVFFVCCTSFRMA